MVPQHPWKNEKHREGGEDEPEGAFGVVGEPLGGLFRLMHPDHGEQGGEWQGDQQCREAVVHQLYLIDHHDDQRSENDFPEIKRGECEDFVPRDAVHGEADLRFRR